MHVITVTVTPPSVEVREAMKYRYLPHSVKFKEIFDSLKYTMIGGERVFGDSTYGKYLVFNEAQMYDLEKQDAGGKQVQRMMWAITFVPELVVKQGEKATVKNGLKLFFFEDSNQTMRFGNFDDNVLVGDLHQPIVRSTPNTVKNGIKRWYKTDLKRYYLLMDLFVIYTRNWNSTHKS